MHLSQTQDDVTTLHQGGDSRRGLIHSERGLRTYIGSLLHFAPPFYSICNARSELSAHQAKLPGYLSAVMSLRVLYIGVLDCESILLVAHSAVRFIISAAGSELFSRFVSTLSKTCTPQI